MDWLEFLFDWLPGFSGLQILFLACAVIGGVMLLLRMSLALFLGGGDDLEPGMDMSSDASIIGDSDATFTVISLQGIVGFLLMFGLTGLSMSIQLEASNLVSTSTAGAVGVVTMAVIAWVTFLLRNLDQPGNIKMDSAVGEVGTVYLTIPEGGIGKARINIQNRLRVFEAVAKDKSKIETEARIRVVEVVGGNTLVVEKFEGGVH